MKFIKRLLIFALICIILGVTTIFGFYQYVKPELPDVATLKNVELQTPMQVFSQDGKLIAQFGEKRRIPVTYDQIPQSLIHALIATEDSRFYDHYGIDPIGITRAALVVAMSGSAKQGASTITQQLARNFFLSNEKKLMRKVKEIFIAIHIEQLLSKQEIMELYVNKIFLGYRSYGFGAAARVYFGKDLQDLSLSEIATLAGPWLSLIRFWGGSTRLFWQRFARSLLKRDCDFGGYAKSTIDTEPYLFARTRNQSS
ncbi:Penicillin-binding protein 1A [Vibrio vulnificus]|nr:Penicillin-binding protein 1A [Vibrio vulnificus]